MEEDIRDVNIQMRLFKHFYNQKHESHQELTPFESKVFVLLEEKLFPWLKIHGDVADLLAQATIPKGVVIATGQKYFAMAVHTIRCLRLLNCTLPIEVFYQGKKDLNPESIAFFGNMDNVRTVDIEEIFDNEMLELKGWDVKPFAMLGSRFREVILMDADVLFVQNPSVLFEAPEYQQGAIFFVDRFFDDGKLDHASWLRKILPRPLSEKMKNTLMYQDKSQHLQESGVVVIDKGRRLMGLLSTCLWNTPQLRNEVHKYTWGDKETFWLGFEAIQDPYGFYDGHAGTAGYPGRVIRTGDLVIAGHLAHFDHDRNLLWINDGILANKHDPHSEMANMVVMGQHGSWLGLTLKSDDKRDIPEWTRAVMTAMKDLWDPDPAHLGLPPKKK
jgi:hypothetical protein